MDTPVLEAEVKKLLDAIRVRTEENKSACQRIKKFIPNPNEIENKLHQRKEVLQKYVNQSTNFLNELNGIEGSLEREFNSLKNQYESIEKDINSMKDEKVVSEKVRLYKHLTHFTPDMEVWKGVGYFTLPSGKICVVDAQGSDDIYSLLENTENDWFDAVIHKE